MKYIQISKTKWKKTKQKNFVSFRKRISYIILGEKRKEKKDIDITKGLTIMLLYNE